MKTLLLIAIFALGPLAFADVKTDVLKDPAVRGAMAHAKRFSGAKSCEVYEVKIKDGQFDLWIGCNNPGDPAEEKRVGVGLEASGHLHVTGTAGDGYIMLEKIEFSYAG